MKLKDPGWRIRLTFQANLSPFPSLIYRYATHFTDTRCYRQSPSSPRSHTLPRDPLYLFPDQGRTPGSQRPSLAFNLSCIELRGVHHGDRRVEIRYGGEQLRATNPR